jgi:hypothetical protein
MREAILSQMFCPYCGFELEIEKLLAEKDGSIQDAILRCKCNSYPVLDGVLLLRACWETKKVVRFLKEGERENGLLWALKGGHFRLRLLEKLLRFSVQHKIETAIRLLFARKKRKYARSLKVDQDTTFRCLFREYYGYDYYFPYRFSSPNFLGSIPLVSLYAGSNGMVLDTGCGVGHSTFLLSKYVKEERIVSIDNNFTFVHLARRFFAQKANYICMDLNSYQLVNPLFEVKQEGGSFHLTRGPLPDKYRISYPMSAEYLPEHQIVDGDLSEIIETNRGSWEEHPTIKQLVRKNVLIDVPVGF